MKMEYLVSALTSHESKPSEIALGSLGLSASTIHSDCPLGGVIPHAARAAHRRASPVRWVAGSLRWVPCSPLVGMESQPLQSRGGGWRRAAEGLSAVWAVKCVCQVTELDTCSPLGPFPGLIDSLPSGHSSLFEELWQRLCLCLLGSRTKGASRSAGERGKATKGRVSSLLGTRGPFLPLLSHNSPD